MPPMRVAGAAMAAWGAFLLYWDARDLMSAIHGLEKKTTTKSVEPLGLNPEEHHQAANLEEGLAKTQVSFLKNPVHRFFRVF